MILKDIHISSDPELGGDSWGTLYTEGEHTQIAIKNEDRLQFGDETLVNHIKETELATF